VAEEVNLLLVMNLPKPQLSIGEQRYKT